MAEDIATFDQVLGASWDAVHQRTIVATGDGEVVQVNLDGSREVLGTGWKSPVVIALNRAGTELAIAERRGGVHIVATENPSRSEARLVGSRLRAIGGLAFGLRDKAVLAVEGAAPGRLVLLSLASGKSRVVAGGFSGASALAVDASGTSALVLENGSILGGRPGGGGAIVGVDLSTGKRQPVVTGLDRPRGLVTGDADSQSWLTAELGEGHIIRVSRKARRLSSLLRPRRKVILDDLEDGEFPIGVVSDSRFLTVTKQRLRLHDLLVRPALEVNLDIDEPLFVGEYRRVRVKIAGSGNEAVREAIGGWHDGQRFGNRTGWRDPANRWCQS